MTSVTQVFGIYDTSAQAGLAVDDFVRSGFEARSITVLPGDDGSGRAFAERKHTRLPAIVMDSHGHDVPLEGTWGLLDPQCGPQTGTLSMALAELDILTESAAAAVLERKVLLSVACVNAQTAGQATHILIRTGALEAGVSGPQPAAEPDGPAGLNELRTR